MLCISSPSQQRTALHKGCELQGALTRNPVSLAIHRTCGKPTLRDRRPASQQQASRYTTNRRQPNAQRESRVGATSRRNPRHMTNRSARLVAHVANQSPHRRLLNLAEIATNETRLVSCFASHNTMATRTHTSRHACACCRHTRTTRLFTSCVRTTHFLIHPLVALEATVGLQVIIVALVALGLAFFETCESAAGCSTKKYRTCEIAIIPQPVFINCGRCSGILGGSRSAPAGGGGGLHAGTRAGHICEASRCPCLCL